MLIRSTLFKISSGRKYFWSHQRYGDTPSGAAGESRNSARMLSREWGSGTAERERTSSLEKVPFQYTSACSGGIMLPARKRFTMYSRLILSSETGHTEASPSPARSIHFGIQRIGRASRFARYVR